MAEDLLEEIEDDSLDEALGEDKTPLAASPGKFGRFKGLLGNKKKRIIFGVALVVLLIAVVGGGILFFSGDKETTETELSGTDSLPAEEPKEEIVFEDIVVLDPFERLSLKSGSALGLINLDIALELINHQDRKQVYAMQDRLRRVVEAKVGERTWLELRNPEGKIRLKYDLLRQMNNIFPKVTIRNIYFINFLMQ